MSLDTRVEELEVRVAFQEDTLQTLNDELASQQQQIEQLQAMLQVVYRELKAAQEQQGQGATAASERPPHY